MAIEKAVSIWELSTSASYGEHDYLIALSFVQKQNQNIRKHFTGPKDIKQNLIVTVTCSRIMQSNKQGFPMTLTEAFDNIMSAFFANPQSTSEMIFFGMDLTDMDVPRHQYRNYRALNKKNLKFPGYAEYARRTCMGPNPYHTARLRADDAVFSYEQRKFTNIGMMASAVLVARELTLRNALK
jgi:hypothetical protein